MKKFLIALSGIYLILVAVLITGVSIIGLILAAKQPNVKMPRTITISTGIMFAIFAAWPLITGIGLILKKNWARYSIFVLSGVVFLMGLGGSLATFSKSINRAVEANSHAIRDGKISTLWFVGIFFIIIPLFFIIFFSRKSIKELFTSNSAGESKSNRPFGVTLIALFVLSGSLSSVMFIFLNPIQKFPLIGSIMISGLALKAYFLIYALLDLYIGIGLLKLRKAAWVVAICVHVLAILFMIENIIMLSDSTLSQIPNPHGAPNIHLTLAMYRITMCIMLLIPLFILVYLIAKRNLFIKKQAQISINA